MELGKQRPNPGPYPLFKFVGKEKNKTIKKVRLTESRREGETPTIMWP
jgi:hypothetical protein